jgi:hypothetical protein
MKDKFCWDKTEQKNNPAAEAGFMINKKVK